MRLRDRRIVEQIARPISDHAVESLGARVDALERRRGGDELERAAHREALAGAMDELRAALSVENRDAEASALARFDRGETRAGERQAIIGRGTGRPRARRGDRGKTGQDCSTVCMQRHEFSLHKIAAFYHGFAAGPAGQAASAAVRLDPARASAIGLESHASGLAHNRRLERLRARARGAGA
jgi:hypothetical protein